jgi:hypothetical protein
LPSMLPSMATRPGFPSRAADTALVKGASSGSGETDIVPMSLPQAGQTYGSVEADTAQLTSSVNADIIFSLRGSARLGCSAGGCTVGATVSDSYVSGSGTQVAGGQVTASMTGTVMINGLPGGSCTATTTFPAHGTGSVSCYDPGAGAIWQEAQATAAAAARASGATSYEVRSTAKVSVQAQALVQAEVTRLITQERQDQQYATCRASGASTSAYAPGTWQDQWLLAAAVHPTAAPANCGIRFVVNPRGETIDLAKPTTTARVGRSRTGKGWVYDVDPGMGMSPRAVRVRIMEPVTTGPYLYPNGYLAYMNAAGQTTNPLTGQIVSNDDPYAHIPLP